MEWYSQKAFQSTNRHYLPRIYCSKLQTMVLVQKCGYLYQMYYINVEVY